MAESHLEFTRPAHVVGRYALYGRLAAGGMATVHLGRMMEGDGTARTVAVKRLHPQFCKDPEFVAMFIDEARLAARIKHPNVVETLDILTMGQELLLVMEYIRGECFSKLLRAARRKNLEPSIEVVGRIASGMLHGLHAAHEARDDRGEPLHVVHRDISPQNVMIDVDGAVKVLDFGVAKASARIQITRDGQMKGKLSYMSPEQLQGLPVDRRADVFACGVVLWEALTRRRLFVGEDASEVLRKILRDEVPPPSQFVPELSPEVDAVALRALCKDPDRRYQTAEDLALDIENIIGLASEADVSIWVHSVAGEILGKRERLLQEIERLGPESMARPGNGAGASDGSIADSDTFQRIQSWAEREAARALDLASPAEIAAEDVISDAGPTVADARCVESRAAEIAAGAEASFPPVPTEVERAGADARQRLAAPAAPAATMGTAQVVAPAFAPILQEAAESRRRRRFWAVLAAASVFAAIAGFALLAGPPVALVRSSGALLPEAAPEPGPRPPARVAAAEPAVARGTGAEALTALKAAEGPAPIVAPASQVEPSLGAAQAPGPVAPAAKPGTTAQMEQGDRDGLARRASPALAQAPKERARSVPKHRSSRRAVAARRARAPASKPVPAQSKDDCRQPYWIDERGIRRIKLACLE